MRLVQVYDAERKRYIELNPEHVESVVPNNSEYGDKAETRVRTVSGEVFVLRGEVRKVKDVLQKQGDCF